MARAIERSNGGRSSSYGRTKNSVMTAAPRLELRCGLTR
jgi:hypothetical protein